ncbi:hypothetical protein ACVWZK_001464 [Bradyrhizobium sp. GM0.4]
MIETICRIAAVSSLALVITSVGLPTPSLSESCECKSCNNAECCVKILAVCKDDCDTYTWDSATWPARTMSKTPVLVAMAQSNHRVMEGQLARSNFWSFSPQKYTTAAIKRLLTELHSE